jgi:hypothetical protein
VTDPVPIVPPLPIVPLVPIPPEDPIVPPYCAKREIERSEAIEIPAASLTDLRRNLGPNPKAVFKASFMISTPLQRLRRCEQ